MDTNSIDSRGIKLKLIDGSYLNGQVNLNRDPRYDRLSDLVSSDREPFLVLFAAKSYSKKKDSPMEHETLFVNKNFIIWAEPNQYEI
jgi:hypothetical protein